MTKRPSKPVQASRGDAYEVGYGRPPSARQFQPGRSGNPKGRPKGARALGRDLDRKITVIARGRSRTMTKRDVISRKIVDDACRGDHRAIRQIREETRHKLGPPSEGTGPSPGTPRCDQTDRAILAAYAALIRSGATMPGEPGDDPVAPRDDGATPSHAPVQHWRGRACTTAPACAMRSCASISGSSPGRCSPPCIPTTSSRRPGTSRRSVMR